MVHTREYPECDCVRLRPVLPKEEESTLRVQLEELEHDCASATHAANSSGHY